MPLESALSSIPQKDLEKKEDFPGRRGSPVGKAPLGSRPSPAQKNAPDEPFVMKSEKKELSRVPHLLDDAGSHPSPGGSFSASTPVSCSDTSDRPADSEPAAAGSKGTEEASSADRPSPSAPSLPKFFCFGGIPRNVGSFPFSWDLLLCGGNNIDPLRRFFHGNGKVFLSFFLEPRDRNHPESAQQPQTDANASFRRF